MNRTLQKRVLETIAGHLMIRPGDRIGIGVSGGADSVALLHLLAELRAELGIEIFVLHFHHQLRGTDADEDERFVKTLATELHFDFISDHADVAGEARRNGWNLEDAARRLRYRFFAKTADSEKLDRVAVAHSMDDQAETVLAHILRGTGPTGLAGIYPVAGLIIRPLLEIGREELREYLSGLGRSWREDASNQDTLRVRARIRHQLLPSLRRDFAPASVTRLARLAGFAREEETFWKVLEEERFAALATQEPSGNISLRIADLLSPLPLLANRNRKRGKHWEFAETSTMALTRRLVRHIVGKLRGNRQQLTAQHVQDVLDLAVKSQSGAKIGLPGVLVERVFDRLVFSATPSQTKKVFDGENASQEISAHEFEYSISLPGPSNMTCIVVPEIQKRFDLKVIDWPLAARETIEYRGILDFDKLRWPLVLRNWRPGDSYRPYGHRRTRKLKRLFLESRVPRISRATWPVLMSAGQVVWVSGCPVGNEFAAQPGTLTGLAIAEKELHE